MDIDTISAGEKLYAQYCASSHMADLSGDPDWKTPSDDGVRPPPPRDATGHTWHHPDQLLLEIVRDGLEGLPSGMLTFGSVLTDEKTLSVLEFIKSGWGEEERAFQWQVTWRAQQ